MRAQNVGKASRPPRNRAGEIILNPRAQRGPESQPSTFTARGKGGYDPTKGQTKDKSPQSQAKKKAYKASGIKGRSRR